MIEYGAEGTLGDAYMFVCRLYRSVKEGAKITIHHYTRHRFWWPKIENIYGLLPSLTVKFHDKPNGWKGVERLEITPFPELPFADPSRHNLPKEYVGLTVKTGRHSQKKRSIKPFIAEWIIEDYEDYGLPVVLLGDELEAAGDRFETKNKNVIDLRGKTTLWEAFAICRDAKEFVGFQGMLSFVALSQKVPTTVYVAHETDRHAVQTNIMSTEWKNYCVEVVQI